MKKIDRGIENEIIRLYSDGYGTMKLSEKFNLHRATIQKTLKRNKIKLRKKSTTFDYDIDFFSEYNIDNCYWAGFIAADGNIRKNRDTLHIKLAVKDKDHLEKFLDNINATYNVKNNKENSYSYININGAWFVKDLKNNFNITPQKSLTLKFPTKMPVEFIPHFIRGYFDGDGSISKHSGIYKITQINFVGTEDVLNYFKNHFYYCLGVRLKSKNKFPPLHNAGNTYIIGYSGVNAIKILEHLYLKSSHTNRLNRKYNKYKEFV